MPSPAALTVGRMSKSKLLAALVVALNLTAPAAHAAGDWTWPVRGDVITGYRNGDDAYASGQHRGIDIAAHAGDAVVAAAGGTVTFAGVAGSSGLTVAVRTSDGRFDTSYLHLSSAAVAKGDAVGAGDRLGAVGTSGRRSADAPHLHFGVREAGSRHAYRDPLTLLLPPAGERPAPSPRQVPVPVVAPEPAAPATAPVAAAVPALSVLPSLTPVPARAPVAAVRRAPRPAVASMRPHALPSGDPARSGPAAPVRPPHPGSRPAPHGHTPQRRHAAGLGSGPRSTVAAPRGESRPVAAPRGRPGGIDVGWLAACVGLVGAAAALGRSGKGGAGRRRMPVGIARLIGSHGR